MGRGVNDLNPLWVELSVQTIIGGKSPEGRLYLADFLKDYTSAFGGTVNAQCAKCLKEYINKYRNKIMANSNTPSHGYTLKKKYNGIQLPNGGEPVNNATLTAEQAKELLDFYKDPAKIFEKYPTGDAPTGDAPTGDAQAGDAPAEPFKITSKTTLAQLKEYADANGIVYADDVTKKELLIDVEAHLSDLTA